MSRTAAWLLAVAALAVLAGCPKRADLPRRERIHPYLQLESVGPVQVPTAQLQGRVLLVVFMATWCLPCLQELPELVRLQKQYGARGFSVVMVGMDLEGAVVLEPFGAHYELPFPLLIADERIRSGQSPFGRIVILPTNYLIDRQGNLRVQLQGLSAPDELEQLVRSELESNPG